MVFFNSFAPFYDGFMRLFNQDSSLRALAENLSFVEGDKVLDVGGGTGRLLEHLPSFLDVVVVDPSSKMLERASRKIECFRSYQLLNGKAQSLPFDNDSFDYVICADALHHFEGVRESIREMVRVLKGAGLLVILEFTPRSSTIRLLSSLEQMVGEPGHFYLPEDLRGLLEEEGCQVKIETISSSQYIIEAWRGERYVKY